jgi:hypothetical protein
MRYSSFEQAGNSEHRISSSREQRAGAFEQETASTGQGLSRGNSEQGISSLLFESHMRYPSFDQAGNNEHGTASRPGTACREQRAWNFEQQGTAGKGFRAGNSEHRISSSQGIFGINNTQSCQGRGGPQRLVAAKV